MHSLSKLIVTRLISISSTNYSSDDIDVFIYGVECTLNEVLTDSIIILWGIYTHTVIELLVWLTVFTLFRHQTGGLHSKSNIRCFLYTITLGISVAFFSKMNISFCEELLIYAFSITIVLLLAPRKNSKIALTNYETKQKKFFSTIIVIITFMISLFCPHNIKTSLDYSIFVNCILLILDYLLKDIMHLLN